MNYNFPRKRIAIKAGTYSLSKMQKIVMSSTVKGMLYIWKIVGAFVRIGLNSVSWLK